MKMGSARNLAMKDIAVDGIKLVSRHGDRREIDAMLVMVEAIPAILERAVREIFWNSKHGTVAVSFETDFEPLAEFLVNLMYIALYEAKGLVPSEISCLYNGSEFFKESSRAEMMQ